MPPTSPLAFKHLVLAVCTPACLHPVIHCTTASPYLSLSSVPFSSFSFPTAVIFGAHPYRYQRWWERSGPALFVAFPALPLPEGARAQCESWSEGKEPGNLCQV